MINTYMYFTNMTSHPTCIYTYAMHQRRLYNTNVAQVPRWRQLATHTSNVV